RRTEVRRRHRKRGNTGHQQHGKHGVARADDRAAQLEHRPISGDHAGLREQIDAECAGNPERDLAEPERERRPEITAEQKFVAYGEENRNVAGWRAVEYGWDDDPERGLRQRRGPEYGRGTSAQKFDNKRYVMHRPARGEMDKGSPNAGLENER